jgi:hypothetical protein
MWPVLEEILDSIDCTVMDTEMHIFEFEVTLVESLGTFSFGVP